MNFLINNVTLDYYMEKMGLKEKERAVWLERIRNDFNERIDNNELVKTILNGKASCFKLSIMIELCL